MNYRPEWSPDGRALVFISSRGGKTGIWRQAVDGNAAELLYQPEVEPFEAVYSPDGKWLVFRTAPGSTLPRDILALSLVDKGEVVPIVTSPYSENLPRLSPDGRWLTYQSNESGRFEIYVRPFPQNGARIQVSDEGGTEQLWGRDGRTLYYRSGESDIVAVRVMTGAEFTIGERSVALTGEYLSDVSHANYDIAPDGRFLMLKRAGAKAQTIVVHNWGAELRQKIRAPRE